MRCKGNQICLDSTDGWTRCTVSGIGLGLLLWIAWGSKVGPQEQDLGCLANLCSPWWERQKQRKECIPCEFMDCKENCTCICFLLLKTCESCCYERKMQLSPSWKWATAGTPRGSGTHQTWTKSSADCTDAAPMLPPDGQVSASWALGHELPREQRSSNLSGSCPWARRIPNVSGLPTHPECSLLTLNGKSKAKSNVLNWKLRNVEQQLNFYGPVHVDTGTWLALKISPGVSNAPAVPTHSNLHCPVWPAPTLQSLLLRYNNVRLTPVTEKRCETGKQFSTTVLRTFYELGNLPGTWNSKMHRI